MDPSTSCLERARSSLVVCLSWLFCLGQSLVAQDPDILPPLPPPSRLPGAETPTTPDYLIPPSPGEAPSQGDWQAMEVKLREQLEQSPDNEETILQLAVVLTKQSREMEATHLLNNALVQNPYSTKIAMGLGQLYLQVERIDYALQVFESLQCAHPCLADLNYWLGSAQLRSGRPLTAFRTLLYGQHSTEKMVHAQQLLRGAALASLGLQCEANQEFMGVYHCTEDAELRSSALELQNQMDDALNSLPRLRGSLKYGVRFDDNPGVVPSFNQLGISPLMPTPSWGNSVVGQLTYDLYRDDNRDLVTGYTMFHTTNFTNHTFDLLDNAVFLSASERGLINETPYISSLSGPFRNYCIGYALR